MKIKDSIHFIFIFMEEKIKTKIIERRRQKQRNSQNIQQLNQTRKVSWMKTKTNKRDEKK